MVKLSSCYRKVKDTSNLVILEADKFLKEKMKLTVSKEHIRKLRKVLKSKLNGGNLARGVDTWAGFLLRYSAAFASWRKS